MAIIMKCSDAARLMHDYLDQELPRDQCKLLQLHLRECPQCEARFRALERTDALVHAMPAVSVPDDLASRIMKSLPKSHKPKAWTGWVQRHPAASAAAFFLVVMLSSFVAMWNQDDQLKLSGDVEHVVVRGHTVIIPAGQTVKGNLTIENGEAQVLGEVEGNLTVIDGNVTLASTAHIAGKVKTVDRALDWVWYKVTSWFDTVAYGS